MKIDFDSPIPLYFQIQQQLREKILDGTYAYGKEVPTEMELCEMFGVSRYTVRQALDGLVKENLIQRKKRKGTIVTYNQEYPRISSILGRVRKNQQYRLFKCERRPATDSIRALLGEKELEEVVFFCRGQIADGRLVSVDSIYLPPRWAEGIEEHPEESIMLHRWLEKTNAILLDYRMDISVGKLNAEEQALTGIEHNEAVLTMYTRGMCKSECVFVGKTAFVENLCYINLNFDTVGNKLSFSEFAIDKGDIDQRYNVFS